MKQWAIAILLSAISFFTGCKMEEKETKKHRVNFSAPEAKKFPHKYTVHGQELTDYYSWLRDDSWPDVKNQDVLDYLDAENSYFDAIAAPMRDGEAKLFDELKGRIQEDDESVPIKRDAYYYYSFINKGDDYSTFARKYESLKADAEIILDQNQLAKGREYFSLGGISVSPNHKLLAYSTDFKGDERYSIVIKDLTTCEMLNDEVQNTSGGATWHESGAGFFYTKLDEKWRARQIFFHTLGTPASEDRLIYKEDDETFRVSVGKTGSKDYIIISTSSSEEAEKYYLDARKSDFDLKLVKKREPKILFSLTHKGDHFYYTINDAGVNFRIVRTPVDDPSNQAKWEEVIAHNPEHYIESFAAYDNFFALDYKTKGLSKIELYDNELQKFHDIEFADAAFEAGVSYTTYDDPKLRYYYSSLRTPAQTLEYDHASGATNILKEQVIPYGFDASKYSLKREWVAARDGAMVPITILYNKKLYNKNGQNPLYLYGYGSYGISMYQGFRTSIFSLVDRGYVYVLASIRGGDDLGKDWHEQAKFTNKKRTFHDFIDVADYLVEKHYTKAGQITISGGSAGGMLIGYCINARPELYKSAVMHVPFVDVLNTMLDENLPLTPGEFKEWGNPKEKEIFDYMITYSPYENIKRQAYPHIFVTAGLADPRVTYWEPAKFVAKLREYKTDDNILLLKTNMAAGHAGKSGRYDSLKEVAEEYNLILNLLQ